MRSRRFVVLVAVGGLVVPIAVGLPQAVADGGRATAATVPSSRCFPSTDNGDPVLSGLDFFPKQVDARSTAQDVTFTATATDTGGPGAPSGVVSGTAYVSFDGTDNWVLSTSMAPDGAGALVGKLTIIPQYRTATRYVSLTLADAAGNTTHYTTDDLAQMGLPTTFTTTTTRDTRAPSLRTVTLSKTTIDTRQHRSGVRIRVAVVDDSAVEAIRVFLWGSPIRASAAHLRLIEGSAAEGTWTGRIRVPRWQGNSTAKLAIELTDVAGRFRFYGPKKLAAIGQPGTVRILSNQEPEPPRIRIRSVSPTSIDLRDGVAKTVTVTFRVTDRGSGARKGAISWFGPDADGLSPSVNGRATRVSGTAHDGIWRAKVTFDPCQQGAGRWKATVFSWDLGPDGTYDSLARALTVANSDIRQPAAQISGDTFQLRRSGPITVLFDEDVSGVDGANAQVRVGQVMREAPGDAAPAVAGAWSCANAAGGIVDCLSGPVRTATFTPDAPMAAATDHNLVINPEHYLGVTDLAGNPFPPATFMGFHTL